jgi:WD40 repeat protein/serine/threonine protein kinase
VLEHDEPSPADDEDASEEGLIRALWAYDDLLLVGRPAVIDTESLLGCAVDPDVAKRLNEDCDTIRLLSEAAGHLPWKVAESALDGDLSRDPPVDATRTRVAEVAGTYGSDASGSGAAELPNSFGRFEIIRELGRGGLGVVLLAHDPILHRDVALKLPRPEALLTPDLRTRFLREAQAAARLTHKHIVTIYEVGHVGAITYIAAAYCQGMNLAEWIHARDQDVPARQAARIVADIADGIDYAHQEGVLHRDLKPSNVLLANSPATADVAQSENALLPKVSDFGLARIQDLASGDTRTGLVMGTPSYMAPEQAEGRLQDVGKSTDVYGLGAILYELLVGRPPFRGACDADTLCKVVANDPTPPRTIRPDVPRDLEAICLKCLEKSPASRYASCAALAADLRRFLADEPTNARPLSPVRKSWRWSYRHPALSALCVVSVAAILTIGAGSLWYSWRLAQSLAQTEDQRNAAVEAQKIAEHHRQAAERNAQEAARQEARNSEYLYATRMRLAYQAYGGAEVKQVAGLLTEYEEGTRWSALRGFEWHYLRNTLDDAQLVLRGHVGEVYGVAYSPDGKSLLSAGEDGTIRLWDPASGRELHVVKAHDSCTNDLAFSPDGLRVASTSCDGTTKIWDAATWQQLMVLRSTDKIIACAEFSPDGRWLATGARDRAVVRIWDTKTGEQIVDLEAVDGACDGVAWSPDGRLLAASNIVKGTRVWDTTHWQLLAVGPASYCVTFSRDSKWTVLGDGGLDLFLWNMQSWQRLGPFGHHDYQLSKVVLTSDGGRMLSCGSDRVVREWDFNGAEATADGELQKPVKAAARRVLTGHEARVQDLVLSPDNRTLASASFDGTVRVWDLEKQGDDIPAMRCPVLSPLEPHIALSPDLTHLIVVDHERRITDWDVARAEVAYRHTEGLLAGNWQWSLSPDGGFAFGTNAEEGLLLTTDSQHLSATIPWRIPSPQKCAFSADGHYVATAGADGFVRVWDTHVRMERYSECFLREIDRHSTRVNNLPDFAGAVPAFCMALSRDGRLLAINNVGQAILDLEAETRLPLVTGHGYVSFEFFPNGAFLLAGHASRDGFNVRDYDIIDTATGHQVQSLATALGVSAVTCSPDNRTIATGFDDGQVKLWHLGTGQELTTLKASLERIVKLQFSTDGRKLAAAALNKGTGDVALFIWSAEPHK